MPTYEAKATLTDRQIEILCRHGNGQTLGQIASTMYLSYVTVRKDVERVKQALRASTLANVVVQAIDKGHIILSDGRCISGREWD